MPQFPTWKLEVAAWTDAAQLRQAQLSQAVSDLEMRIEESRAVVSIDPLPTVMAHMGQMGKLFQNLIGNAIKFRTSDPPHIQISAKPADSRSRLRCRSLARFE